MFQHLACMSIKTVCMKVAACLRAKSFSNTIAIPAEQAVAISILSDPIHASRRFLANFHAELCSTISSATIARAKTLSGGPLLPFRTRALGLSRK